jgi:hypothetical protein
MVEPAANKYACVWRALAYAQAAYAWPAASANGDCLWGPTQPLRMQNVQGVAVSAIGSHAPVS